jgi:hypothetical protein
LTGDGGSLNDQLMPMDQSATGSASLEPSSAALMPPSSAGPWDNHRHTLRYERRLASATKQCVDQIRRLSAGTRGRRRETIVEVADFLTRGDHPQPQEAQAQAHKRLAETRRRAIPMVGGGQNTRAVKRQKLMRRFIY